MSTGLFTVNSAYRALKKDTTLTAYTHSLWMLRVPPRVKVFGWLMANNKLLAIDNLRRRGWPMTNMCVMCCRYAESIQHMISRCQLAIQMYRLMDIDQMMRSHPVDAILQTTNNRKERGTLLVAMFII